LKVFLVLEAGEELQFLKAWQAQVVQRLQVHLLQAWQVEEVLEFLQLKVL
jgi:hypothetical protein